VELKVNIVTFIFARVSPILGTCGIYAHIDIKLIYNMQLTIIVCVLVCVRVCVYNMYGFMIELSNYGHELKLLAFCKAADF